MTENSIRHTLVLRAAQVAHGVGLFVLCLWTFVTLVPARSTAGFEWANHDVANTLYVGRVMAEGKRLYVDILELNPPGIFLLAESVERVARVVRLSAFHVYHVGVLLLVLYGGWLLQRIVNVTKRLELLILVGLAHLIVAFGAGLPGDRGFVYSFGQREHLFVLAFIPYVFCASVGRVAIGPSTWCWGWLVAPRV